MKRRSIAAFLLLGLLSLAPSGCRDAGLDTEYGSRQSADNGQTSVNGVGVFSDMFSCAGHVVNSTGSLTPRLKSDVDVFVWFSNDYMPPGPAARKWMENWLKAKPGAHSSMSTAITTPRPTTGQRP